MRPTPTPLTLSAVLAELQHDVDDLCSAQIDDPTHPAYGGIFRQELGMADPRLSDQFIVAVAYLALGRPAQPPDPARFDQAILAADYLLRAQRSSGLIDLPSVNIDSSPDTAFSVQEMCPVIEWGRSLAAVDPRWAALIERLERFVRRSVPGLLTGGFHTPNHRWVIVSALLQARTLFPELDLTGEISAVAEAYLAEGFDVDADGCFIEHSIGNYDAVNNRSLLLIAAHRPAPDALDAVARNLAFDLHMLHADGTAITNLSTRFDYGSRNVPVGLIGCLLLLNHARPDPRRLRAALALWQRHPHAGGTILWLCHALLTTGDPRPDSPSNSLEEPALPDNFARVYDHNGLWRVRRGPLSAAIFRDRTNLLSLLFGQAELTALKISFTYFGDVSGWFFGDTLQVDGSRAVLRSEGKRRPRRPGYEQPLGRPVPPERWAETMPERALRHVPPLTSSLTIDEVTDGLDLHLQTLDGLDHVAAQIAFDFAPGGIWETPATRFKPQAGQEIFLTQGLGAMRFGHDVIRIGPGQGAHTFWQMRAAEAAPHHVRVLLTFFTPVDAVVELRTQRTWQTEF